MPNSLRENGVPQADAVRALERLLGSRAFANSSRLSHFLRYTVEQTLAGQAESLKEYTIGTNAYGRRSDFDPSQDTIVRTEARRLRRKLKEYYEGEGQRDEVVIFFRSGSYVPVIHWRDAVEGSLPTDAAAGNLSSAELWMQGDGVWVAVAPFTSQPGEELASSFAFGLGEEILHRLTGLRGVRVVAELPTDKAALAGADRQNGSREVHIVIGGTVRREHDLLRVTVRVTTANGLVLWSQRYDTAVEQKALLRMQEAVAAALLSRIAPRETIIQRFAAQPTETLYKLYAEVLAAEALLEESTHVALSKALRNFEELKQKAPEYPRLDCGIAQCCIALAQRGDSPAGTLVARAGAVARDLIARSPELPEAHSILGMALAQEWKWEAAEKSFRTALSLGTQHSIHRQFGVFLLMLGRFPEAWEHLRLAEEIDPFSAPQKLSMARFFAYSRWHQEAETYYRSAASYGELPIEPAWFQALWLLQRQQPEKALAMADRLQRQAGALQPYQACVAELYALCGEQQRARRLVEQGRLLDRDASVSHFRRASLALALHEQERALHFLETALEHREPELPWLVADPRLDSLRGAPQYGKIVRAIFPQ